MEKEVEQAHVQSELIVTDEVEENGLFTVSEQLQQDNLDALATAGIEIDAPEDLFDLSLLDELLQDKPELTEVPTAGSED